MARGEADRFTPLREQSRRIVGLRILLFEEAKGDVEREAQVRVPSPDAQVDREYQRAYRTPVEEAEEQDRELQAYKRSGTARAVWRHRVGPAPTRGQAEAGRHLEALVEVLDEHRSGIAPLTRSESAYLRRQIDRWTLRAAGLDRRYAVLGTKPGRPRVR